MRAMFHAAPGKKGVRSRSWFYTLHKNENVKSPDEWKCETVYHISANEVGAAGKTPHWQGCVWLKSACTLAALKKKTDNTANWSIVRDWGNAIEYCKKEKDFKETGTPPRQGQRTDLLAAKRQLEEGCTELELAKESFPTWVKYERSFKRYKQLLQKDRDWETEVIVYCGSTGTGKSHAAFVTHKGSPITYCRKSDFFLGYTNQETVVLDDWDDSMMPKYMFKALMDKYPMVVNVKGGEAKWNPRRVIITTNSDPEGWYMRSAAARRRINQIVHLDKLYEEPQEEDVVVLGEVAGGGGSPPWDFDVWAAGLEEEMQKMIDEG